MTRPAVVALLVLALPLAAAPVPKGLKKQLASLDGDWRWETQESNGQVRPATASDYCLWRVAGDTMTLDTEKGGMKPEPCGFVSQPKDGGPRSFEYKVNSNGYHRRGVCELVDADTLLVAFHSNSNTPPAEVKSTANVTLYTFKRVKP